MTRLVLSYRPPTGRAAAWPADPRWRFLVYLGISITAWIQPPWGALLTGLVSLILGRREPWGRWLLALGWFWLFLLAPLITELAGQWLGVGPPDLWAASGRCLTFLVLMMASQWFTAHTTIFEMQTVLAMLLRPIGRRRAAYLSFLASLTIGFIPWALDEFKAVDEAAQVRGAGRRSLRRRFASLGMPVFVRVVAKARHCAEAIELRGGTA